MEPKDQTLEKEIPFGNHHFQVPCLTSGVYNIKFRDPFLSTDRVPGLGISENDALRERRNQVENPLAVGMGWGGMIMASQPTTPYHTSQICV